MKLTEKFPKYTPAKQMVGVISTNAVLANSIAVVSIVNTGLTRTRNKMTVACNLITNG
jgi:hypothetical protein